MIRKIVLSSILAISLTGVSRAELIELNTHNASICRQQLLSAKGHPPVVMVYMKDCPWSGKVMPLYKQISEEHPELPLYLFEFTQGYQFGIAKTAHDCMGFFPFYSPSFVMLNINFGDVQGVEKQGLSGSSTIDDIRNFIEIYYVPSQHAYTLIK